MPVIHVSLFEGRSLDAKRAFVKAITDCSVEFLQCKPEAVTVILSEMTPAHYAKAGKLKLDLMAEEGKTKAWGE